MLGLVIASGPAEAEEAAGAETATHAETAETAETAADSSGAVDGANAVDDRARPRASETEPTLSRGEHPAWRGELIAYTVRSGDTAWRIASRHRTSVGRLCALNDQLADAEHLVPGQQLLVPLPAVTEDGPGDEAQTASSCELVVAAEREEIELPLPTDATLRRESAAAREEIELPPPRDATRQRESTAASGEPEPRQLIYGERVSAEFRQAVIELCRRLALDPDHLMAIMHYETAGSFRPSIRNRYTGAVGLIQFLPSTARSLGATDTELAALDAVSQLAWVERYLTPFRGHLTTLEDAYMAVLYPAAVEQPNDFVLFRRGSTSYERNPGLDRDDDGTVTKGEVGEAVRRVFENGRAALAPAP